MVAEHNEFATLATSALRPATVRVRYSPVMRRLVCVIGALALTAGGAGASTVASGLRGAVYATSGGACLDSGCAGQRPVAGQALVFSVAGRASVRTVTRPDGTFSVRLAPGMWTIRLGGDSSSQAVTPSRAQVERGKYRRVTLLVRGGAKVP
jgi:hypothetical protein